MVKRKVEPSPDLGLISEESENVTTKITTTVEPELGATAVELTGEGQSKEFTHGHVIPITATMAEEGSLEPHPFWDMLSLAGYQTW